MGSNVVDAFKRLQSSKYDGEAKGGGGGGAEGNGAGGGGGAEDGAREQWSCSVGVATGQAFCGVVGSPVSRPRLERAVCPTANLTDRALERRATDRAHRRRKQQRAGDARPASARGRGRPLDGGVVQL